MSLDTSQRYEKVLKQIEQLGYAALILAVVALVLVYI
jgi:hypothetical protein